MQIIDQFSGFEWDSANRDKNWKKHKVTWGECEEAFFNQPLYVFHDKDHSSSEARYYALGKTNISRLLFMVFTKRINKVRIISARDMHTKERKIYHEKTQEDSKV